MRFKLRAKEMNVLLINLRNEEGKTGSLDRQTTLSYTWDSICTVVHGLSRGNRVGKGKKCQESAWDLTDCV